MDKGWLMNEQEGRKKKDGWIARRSECMNE